MIQEFHQDNVFNTERLLVRKLKLEDFDPFFEMQGDFEVLKYITNKAESKSESLINLKDVISKYDDPVNEFWVWAIDRKEDGAFIGTVAIVKDREDNWEVGYRFLRKYWGNGFATEILSGLLALCESIPGIDNVVANTDLRNVASQKVLSKAGFVNLGIKYNDEYECEDYIYSASTHL